MSAIKNSLSKPRTGRLLEQYFPIVFGPQLMKEFGRAPAIFLQKLHYWLTIEGDHIGLFIDGKRWIYNTHQEWVKSLGVYSKKTIYRVTRKLEDLGIISSRKLNAQKGKHQKGYTINYEVLASLFPWISQQNGYQAGFISSSESPLKKLQPIVQKNLPEIDNNYTPQDDLNFSPNDSNRYGQNGQFIYRKHRDTNITSILSGKINSKRNENNLDAKPRKEKNNKPEIKESKLTEANQTIYKLVEIYNKQIGGEKVTLNKRLAKWLMAAFQKIGSCLKKWETFCKRIATSDWVMGRVTNGFKASLSWLLRFDIIDRILGGDFKCKEPHEEPPTTTQQDEEELIREIENSETSVEEQNVKKTLLKTFGIILFKCWLREARVNLEHGKVILLVKSLFYKDYIEELLGQKTRKLYPTVLIQIDDGKFS